MKHLRLFKTEAELSTYKSGSEFILPNVNYVIESDSVEFNPYVELIQQKAGDIVYYTNGNLKTTPYTNYNTSMGPAVGVIVIPKGFAPDGKSRMVALSGQTNTIWSNINTDTTMTHYTALPTTDNTGTTTTGSATDGYLPSDKFAGTVSYVDPITHYSGTNRTMIPSPYLTVDGKNEPNPAYYAEISGYNNVLSDFNGLENTQTLIELDSANYKAASHCWNYKDSANSTTQWYLPACGELGYMIPRFSDINAGLAAVGADQLFSFEFYWSSSEFSSRHTYCVAATYGDVNCLLKNADNPYVRPWAVVE